MRRKGIILFAGLFWVTLLVGKLQAQDIPLYSQKLTNSFVYNPSVAGNEKGSLTLSHRRFWAGVNDGASSNFLSFHLPFAYDKFGAGLNVFSEKVGIYDRNYVSGAFAYHLKFTDSKSLSMGVSTEYNSFKVSTARLDVRDAGDQLLEGADVAENSMDFSFGMSYKMKGLEFGAALNRLGTFTSINDVSSQLSPFYSAYVRAPLVLDKNRHELEPIVTFRQLSTESNQFDVGLYYTFRDMFTVGGGYRSSGQYTGTVALRVASKVLVGYSYESFNSSASGQIGSSSEFTVRLDLRDRKYYTQTKNSQKIMAQSLAFRRKTLTRQGSKARSTVKKNTNKKLRNRIRRNYQKSPNYRMQSSKKLRTKKSRIFKPTRNQKRRKISQKKRTKLHYKSVRKRRKRR